MNQIDKLETAVIFTEDELRTQPLTVTRTAQNVTLLCAWLSSESLGVF